MCRESFVPTGSGAVVGGLSQRPGAAHGRRDRAFRALGVLHAGGGGGFALHEAFSRRVAGVSNPRVVQFPPIGDGEAAVCGGVAAKVQPHWVKNGEKVLFLLNGSAFWRIRCLSWRVGRT